MTIFILILGFIVVLIMAAPSYGESLDEKRNKIDTQLNELNIDTETYFLKNNRQPDEF